MKQDHCEIPLGFNSKTSSEGLHICYLYSDEDERRRVMRDFVSAGLGNNERILYLVDRSSPEEFIERMREDGLDLKQVDEQFQLYPALETLCPNGHFDSQAMLGMAGDFYRTALKLGYEGARGIGEMGWVLRDDCVQWKDLLRHEALLNETLKEHPLTACCQYDLRNFSGAQILDILSVHPQMIVRGQLVKNPYYMEPQTFLDALEGGEGQPV